jgi:prephenate dehydrogenase
VGLIGGSLALAIKKKRLAKEVWGVFRRESQRKLAEKKKIVDRGTLSLNRALSGSDFVILATPVSTMISLTQELKKILPQDVLVTDVGSSKARIVNSLQRLFPRYVGSHPLAGSEKKGCSNVVSGLFDNKVVILTPTPRSDRNAVAVVKRFWEKLGSKVVIMSPELHDKVLSQISHLPHLAVFGLLNAVNDDYLKYATSGFLDTTRIGASDSRLWLEIFKTNKRNLLKDLNKYISWLERYKQSLHKDDFKKLLNYIQQASDKRRSLNG